MSLSKENKVIIDGQTYYGGLNQPNLKFVKVNVDCWERIFDFLALHDILAMSQTCLRMRQIGGHYYHDNFHGVASSNLSGSSSNLCISINDNPMERVDFLRFVDTIEIGGEDIKDLELLRIASNMDLMGSLTTLKLKSIDLNENQLRGLENIQANIQTVGLDYCSINDNFVGEFLASCPKLKSLRFDLGQFESTTGKASLFQRTYPMLEHFECSGTFSEEAALEVPSFLERNPSIKCLEMRAFDFLKVRLDTSSVQLDFLNIGIDDMDDFEELNIRLKALHANGFFKKLRLKAVYMDNRGGPRFFIKEMISFSALETLCSVDSSIDDIDQLTQLKELYLWEQLFVNDDNDFDSMAMNLVNLERLSITCTVDQLLLFLRYLKKLKLICYYDFGGALDLFKLNEARKMSGTRCKVQIGLLEEQYLATKWKANDLNYDLIEINRWETISKYFDY